MGSRLCGRKNGNHRKWPQDLRYEDEIEYPCMSRKATAKELEEITRQQNEKEKWRHENERDTMQE